MRSHQDTCHAPREDGGSRETQRLPEHDPQGCCNRTGSVVTDAELDNQFANLDGDMEARYLWITHPGEVVSADPPGRDWLPYRTVRKGRSVVVHCVYR